MECSRNSEEMIIIDHQSQKRRYVYRFFKRCFDIVASFIGLLLLSPLFMLIAIAIKVEDPNGPVFYSSIRIGKNQHEFKMYKFRSMVANADQLLKDLLVKNEVNGAMFKMKHDPRVTRVGRFIRKYSLDELPQLLNVLLGNMSLVGPRPPLPNEVKAYTAYDLQRLSVKPGCTGLWQATSRNAVGFDEMVRLDLTYIKGSSLWLDLKILFKTIRVFVNPNTAY